MANRAWLAVAAVLALACEPPLDSLLPRCEWAVDDEFAASVQPPPGECVRLETTSPDRYLATGPAPEPWDVCTGRGGRGSQCIVVSHGEPYYVLGTGHHSDSEITGDWSVLEADGSCPLRCE